MESSIREPVNEESRAAVKVPGAFMWRHTFVHNVHVFTRRVLHSTLVKVNVQLGSTH